MHWYELMSRIEKNVEWMSKLRRFCHQYKNIYAKKILTFDDSSVQEYEIKKKFFVMLCN